MAHRHFRRTLTFRSEPTSEVTLWTERAISELLHSFAVAVLPQSNYRDTLLAHWVEEDNPIVSGQWPSVRFCHAVSEKPSSQHRNGQRLMVLRPHQSVISMQSHVNSVGQVNSDLPNQSPGPLTPGGQAHRPPPMCAMYSFSRSDLPSRV